KFRGRLLLGLGRSGGVLTTRLAQFLSSCSILSFPLFYVLK
ncbi:MAG: hypothetical protein QOI53_3367, partial [Verrucomicrobiota bacterium]|nr:hypothetical protein [Verrucomicrobiota bacterium]